MLKFIFITRISLLLNLVMKYVLSCLLLLFVLISGLSDVQAENIGILLSLKSKYLYEYCRLIKNKLTDSGDFVKLIDLDIGNPSLVLEKIRKEKINYLVCIGSSSTKIGKDSGLPGLFLFVPDPIAQGLMNQDQVPLSNLTGIHVNPDPGQIINLLKKIIPDLHLGTVYDPEELQFIIDKFPDTLSPEKDSFIAKPVVDTDETFCLFEEIKGKINFLITFIDVKVLNRKTIDFLLKFSITNKIPFLGTNEVMTKNGAFINFSIDPENIAGHTSEMIKKLKSGIKPQALKIEFPRGIDYSLNTRIAKIFKIPLSDQVIKGAKNVFE